MRLLKILPLLIVATPVFAQQSGQAPQSGTKASKAEVDQLVSSIKSDNTKHQNYCSLVKLQTQYQAADDKKDQAKLKELDDKIEATAKTLGPEFDRVMSAEIDDASAKSLDDLASSCKT